MKWLAAFFMLLPLAAAAQNFLRYEAAGQAHYGLLEGDTIHQLAGPPYEKVVRTGVTLPLAGSKLLAPSEPEKIIAVGLNYRSHAGMSGAKEPALFAKLPTSVVGHDAPIVIPKDAGQPHYEGEMVVIIAKRGKHIAKADADDYVFAVSAGNDVSERSWQSRDLQWLRAKASDTFGPVGPLMVRGLDYDDLLLETRVNGDLRQSERTSNLIHSVADIVSFVSRYVTLAPGDMIFTGTPGSTRGLKAGDVVEVRLEGVGRLRNPVVRE